MSTTKQQILDLLPSEEELLNVREYLKYQSHKLLIELATSINEKYSGKITTRTDFKIYDRVFHFNIHIIEKTKYYSNSGVTTLTITNDINNNYPLKILFKNQEILTHDFNNFNLKIKEIIQSEEFQNSIIDLLSYCNNSNSRQIIDSLKS
jgi:hypothetical protein